MAPRDTHRRNAPPTGYIRVGDQAPTTPRSEQGHLRIFSAEQGCWEHPIDNSCPCIIGRGEDCAVRLDNRQVSRQHAQIDFFEGIYRLRDIHSRAGTLLNGESLKETVELRHGDTLQITTYVLQFRTDTRFAVNRAQGQIHFSLIPSSIEMRYRVIHYQPEDVFQEGDTIVIGKGGVLLPTPQALPSDCCIEIELAQPGRRKACFLGEILGNMTVNDCLVCCVKLHRVESRTHRLVLKEARRGSWTTAPRQ